MQAVVYTEYGPPDVLRVSEVATPTPKDNELLVRVYASQLGYGDIAARNFKALTPRTFNMPSPLWLIAKLSFGLNQPRQSPAILGSEFAGVVEAVGSAVTRFKVGDAVFGYKGQSMGAHAEYVTIAEDGVVTAKPDNVSYEEAATIPYGAITALNLLRKLDIQPGQQVLVNGASGGIGSFAVQIAKHYGAAVTGVCSTPKVDFVRALGADHVIDYTKEDFTRNGQTYDLIFDILGRVSFAQCKGSLTPDGRLLYASFKLPQLFQMIRTSITGSSKKVICALAPQGRDDLLAATELIEAGVITTVIDRRFPLAEAAEAHRYYESGQAQGKVVITIGANGSG